MQRKVTNLPEEAPVVPNFGTSPAAPPEHSESGFKTVLAGPVFRRIWSASLLSNLGQQMQSVAAAWTMLQLTHRPDMVALVQTAGAIPFMLMVSAAGAIADMYDRRKVAMLGLGVCLLGAAILAVTSATGSIAPSYILLACAVTAAGYALFSPSWQASVAELVGPRAMPSAITLFSLSMNSARSLGPALGGVIIALAGSVVAFGTNVVLFLPILVAMALWQRRPVPPRLPPERLDRAILAGMRYVRHSPPIRRAVIRTFATAFGCASVQSLIPILAHDRLNGGPTTFGILLGCYGLGAVVFGLFLPRLRTLLTPEHILRTCVGINAAATLLIAVSTWLPVAALASMLLGGTWTLISSTFNVSIQTGSPRWVGGRALSMYQTALSGGLALGAALAGVIATAYGTTFSLSLSAAYLVASLGLGFVMPLSRRAAVEQAPAPGADPVVKMALTGRSGPIAVELEYRVPADQARAFYDVMRDVRLSRERNGAFNTTLARDVADPELWIERFHYATWNDYLRARDRPTVDDRAVRDRALAFHVGPGDPRIRRMLERPTGSVRWRDEALDPGEGPEMPALLTPSGLAT